MSIPTREQAAEIDYPDDDGEPLSDNTLQFEWITTIQGGLDALFRDDPDVFVAGNLLWYPVEGDNTTRLAPDAMVAFGRPKGYRGSYMQWVEGGIAPQVVFEVLSPRNTAPDMKKKRAWYFRYKVEEYYEFDPDRMRLRGWIKEGRRAREIVPMSGWVSPRLGIRFELGEDLRIVRPDGRPFVTYVEAIQRGEESEARAEQNRQIAEQEQRRAERERQIAERERQIAERERQTAERERQTAEQERQRREAEHQRAERLAAKLRELGIDPDSEA